MLSEFHASCAITMAVTFEQVQVMVNAMVQPNRGAMAETLQGRSDHSGEGGEESKYNEPLVKYLAYTHSRTARSHKYTNCAMECDEVLNTMFINFTYGGELGDAGRHVRAFPEKMYTILNGECESGRRP